MTISQAKAIIQDVFGGVQGAAFRIRFWDGSEEVVGENPTCTLVFRDEGTFTDLFRTRDAFAFAEAYVQDRFDIEGDMQAALAMKRLLRSADPSMVAKLKVLWAVGLFQDS